MTEQETIDLINTEKGTWLSDLGLDDFAPTMLRMISTSLRSRTEETTIRPR